MVNIIKLKSVNDALTYLSKEDAIAKAILTYYEEEKKVAKKVEGITLSNKEDVISSAKNLNNSKKYLINWIKSELGDKEIDDKSNLVQYVSLYIINNFNKLAYDRNSLNYYNKIMDIRKNLRNNFSLKMQLAIMLRSKMIIDKLYKEEKYETINNFIEYLKCSKEIDDELLYVIYYGLYDGKVQTNLMYDLDEKEDNDKVFLSLLESDDYLPYSIITSLCNDAEFKKYNKSIVITIISMYFKPKMVGGKENLKSIDIIQKLFKNDVKNLNSEACFLNLKPLFDELMKNLYSNDSDYELFKLFDDVRDGKVILEEKKEDKTHGSI